MSVVQTKLRTTTSSGTPILVSATLEYKDGRIFFVKSPYSLKDEIKAMRGSRWHGYDEQNPQKMWSVEDCQRNRFQLSFLMGEKAYAWFDRPLVRHEYAPAAEGPSEGLDRRRPDVPLPHLRGGNGHRQDPLGPRGHRAVGRGLVVLGRPEDQPAEHQAGVPQVAASPSTSFNVEFFTYEGLKTWVDQWKPGMPIPAGLICDESSRCKNSGSQRSHACQRLADMIREKYGLEHGFVIEMSGTPSPKSPVDWWSQCEIAWPGFLREGSQKAMEERMAFMVLKQTSMRARSRSGSAGRTTSRSAPSAARRGSEGPHELDGLTDPDDYHEFEPSVNEVAYLNKRLKGLVTIKHKKDCLDLPDKRYRKIICKPTASLLRVAEAIVQSAPNAVTGMTLLARTERRLPVPRGAGRHDPLHALHRWHGARVDRPAGAGPDLIPAVRHCCPKRSWPGWSSRRCLARSAAAHAKCPSWSARPARFRAPRMPR